jgi:methyl-accepting chemotaxis protein
LVDEGEWGRVLSVYAPIFNSAGDAVGIIGCDFDAEALFSIINNSVIEHIVLASVVLAAGIIILLLFLRLIFNPLSKVSRILKEIAQGEGDLTRKIEVKMTKTGDVDEIGELSGYFNETLNKIKGLIVSIKNEAASLSETGSNLSASMEQTATAVNQITATILSIKSRVENQAAGVTETNETMRAIDSNIKALNGHVSNQAESVARSSAAIEQMIANINQVTSTLVKNAANVTGLSDAAQNGRQGLQAVTADISQIAEESAGLLEINAVMATIASQTNLLSMNAAIEAAHAGQLGQGFAVVADEIRKLAENSSAQSKTISSVLKRMHSGIEKIMQAATGVLERFEAINTAVTTVSTQEENIRAAMEEQNTGSRQILESIGQLNDITGLVKNAAAEMLTGAQQIITEGVNLESVTEEISGGISEMNIGAGEINSAVKDVNESSRRNKDSIDNLVFAVSRFKVE